MTVCPVGLVNEAMRIHKKLPKSSLIRSRQSFSPTYYYIVLTYHVYRPNFLIMSQDPQADADRIRLKRLAKLQAAQSASPRPAAEASSSASSPAQTPAQAPAPSNAPSRAQSSPKPASPAPSASPSTSGSAVQPRKITITPKRTASVDPSPSSNVPLAVPAKKKPITPAKFDLLTWEDETIGKVLKVTLSKDAAEQSQYDLVWLKSLAQELKEEDPANVRLHGDIADRILIARLEIDPQSMSDDLEYLNVLASLPRQQTTFEFLIGCWKRLNATQTAFQKKGYTPTDVQSGLALLNKLRDLLVSYAGLTLQEPEMFPQPTGRPLGPPELISSLLSLSALSTPLFSDSGANAANVLTANDVDQFLQDLARWHESDTDLYSAVMAPIIRGLLFHESLTRPGGLGGGDSGWRGVISGLEALVSVKGVANIIVNMEEWNPPNATAADFEKVSLMGPLCRLNVFAREWPSIAQTYFSEPEKRTRNDVDSTYASLRGTLKSLQTSLFGIFNTLVRASPVAREAVLAYFARVVSLNIRRAGSHVEPDTVASDSFMVNMHSIILRFAEPFMDAQYTKIDRIDPLYFAHSSRIDIKEETRIKATSEEADAWARSNAGDGTPQNFISDVFFLAVALCHYGYLRTIQTYEDTYKHIQEIQRHIDQVEGDGSWRTSPAQARIQYAIDTAKKELGKLHMEQFAFRAQLLEPELTYRSIGFFSFLSTWVVRQADPKKTHPSPNVDLPLPKDVPEAFRTLPEYIIENIVDFYLFVVRSTPESLNLSGKIEFIIFALTFLNSTWYIKNPFLKAKINEALCQGIFEYREERQGILGGLLNTNPMALKHLMPALMHFYIEVEQTGASSQFYDKFNARQYIAYILKVIWDNPTHREALKNEAKNVDKFVRFANLMINDVTYLMDESLGELSQIHDLETEMHDREAWERQPVQYRRERDGQLRQLERHASAYVRLGKSTVDLLKIFTAETKRPFMMPEIVDRLAAMLDYNLDALAGPRCQNLVIQNKEKYHFDPRGLLADILQVFLNLADQEEFVRAVANDGRSYRKELFEKAAGIARKWRLKSDDEIEQLGAFVAIVEQMKATIEAEEDLGEVPEEFLDPLMATLMRDPVILPSSKAILDRATIKSHLLSDAKDPFNRAPLTIEEVVSAVELKAQIDAFIAERRKQKTASGEMDTKTD